MPVLKVPLRPLRYAPAFAFVPIAGAAVLVAILATPASADGGVVAICGNTCVGEERNGDPLCHWAPATPGQSCKAKGICSPGECTVWWTVQAPTADAFQITPAQAKQLPGARTTKGSRHPRAEKSLLHDATGDTPNVESCFLRSGRNRVCGTCDGASSGIGNQSWLHAPNRRYQGHQHRHQRSTP